MFCGECGTENPDTNQFCKNCGRPLRRKQQVPASQPVGVPAQSVYSVPQAPVMQPVTMAMPTPNKGIKALGIVSVIIGILSWFRYPYICGLLAIVLGVVTLYKSGDIKSWAAILGILGIIIGLASIITDIFYFTIFPTPHLVL